MDSTEIRDLFREEVADVELPTLWSDSEIFAYLDDAQSLFCRLTGGLGDATTVSVTQIPITVAGDWVSTSPKILKFRSARLLSDGSKIDIVNFEDLERLGIRLDGRAGPVKKMIIGMEPNKALLYPSPSIVGTIQLIVDRMPLRPIEDEGAKLEIASQHHINLLSWVKHKAYAKQDAETRNDKKSAEFEAKFLGYCEAAKHEKERAMHKTRVVVYGGI